MNADTFTSLIISGLLQSPLSSDFEIRDITEENSKIWAGYTMREIEIKPLDENGSWNLQWCIRLLGPKVYLNGYTSVREWDTLLSWKVPESVQEEEIVLSQIIDRTRNGYYHWLQDPYTTI